MSQLEQIAADLWLAEGAIVSFHGFPYPTRSVVARLPGGGLWIWSPVALSEGIRAEIMPLGPVEHLVSPNPLHHLFLTEWRAAYPRATLWGPSSTIRKRRDLTFAPPLGDRAPEAWQGAFDQTWFRGSFAMDEIVFLHIPSRVAIVADLIQAFDEHFLCEHWSWWRRPLARLGGITAADPKAPLDLRQSFLNRSLARRALDKVLSWDCEQVVLAHGQCARGDGRAFLRRAFRWLER
jgi:hypothetical protein